MLAETLDASVIFHRCGRHNHDPTAASACGDGLKIVWTSEVASTAFRLQRRPPYAVPVFVLRVAPQLLQRYRRRRPDFVVNQP